MQWIVQVLDNIEAGYDIVIASQQDCIEISGGIIEPTVIETLKNICECRPVTHIKTLLSLFHFRKEIGDLLPTNPVMNFRVIGRIYDITIR